MFGLVSCSRFSLFRPSPPDVSVPLISTSGGRGPDLPAPSDPKFRVFRRPGPPHPPASPSSRVDSPVLTIVVVLSLRLSDLRHADRVEVEVEVPHHQ